MKFINEIKEVIKRFPDIIPHLKGRARFIAFARDGEYKSYDYFLQVLTKLIQSVYTGLLNGEFIDIMASLIQGQLMQAFEQAWIDDGNTLPMPASLVEEANKLILSQFDYIDQFFRDIIDARVDGTPIAPLLARANLWANQWNSAYSQANALIALEMGGKLVWRLGQTEQHCSTCSSLDGKVDYAREWDRAGLRPQNAPNGHLDCGGWNCDCALLPTNDRRSYGGIAKLGY